MAKRLVRPGAPQDEIANQARETGFIPENKNIIWHTKLLNASKEEVIEFNVPTKPADYPYMCSFRGHSCIMRGMPLASSLSKAWRTRFQ